MKHSKDILQTAVDFQTIDRQIKALEAKRTPLKKSLLNYAKENESQMDDAFQLKFPNGTYVSLRVKDFIDGDKESKARFLEETSTDFAKIDLDEKAVLAEAPKDNRLRKLLTKLGLKIKQKETFAVYAG